MNIITGIIDDISTIYKAYISKEIDINQTPVKATTAATRTFSRIIMASALGIAISALPILISPFGIICLALSVAAFIIGYDLFKTADNVEKIINLPKKLIPEVSELLKIAANNYKAAKIKYQAILKDIEEMNKMSGKNYIYDGTFLGSLYKNSDCLTEKLYKFYFMNNTNVAHQLNVDLSQAKKDILSQLSIS